MNLLVRALFWVNLSNSFVLHETWVTEVVEGPEFESVVKIVVAPLLVDKGFHFLVDLDAISAGNLGIIGNGGL